MTLRALGGGELIGDKLVRLVYVDEAGISNVSQEPFLVVVGVIVHADKKLTPLKKALDAIVNRHIPQHQREGFVFHATELFNGGGKVFNRETWPIERRLQIANELGMLFTSFKLPVTFGFVDLREFPKSWEGGFPNENAKLISAHVVSYMACVSGLEAWMRTHAPKEICMMVVENNDRARERIKEAHNRFQDPNILQSIAPGADKFFPLRTVQEDPLFQNKRVSSPLQLSDFCAYVMKRILMNNHDDRYLPFFDFFRHQFVDAQKWEEQ